LHQLIKAESRTQCQMIKAFIFALKKNNRILEKSKTNGFSGLASVVDTKSLALPEKWDLANKMSEHITLETIKEAINNSQSKNSTIGAFRAEAKQYAVKGEEKIFWQQLSIGIKDISTRIKQKSGLYKEIERALASKAVVAQCIKL